MFRRRRFPGAGKSAEECFNRELRQNVRAGWKVWVWLVAVMIGFALWGGFAGGVGGRFLLFLSGALFGAGIVAIALGGHVSTFRWWQGAEGERETADQIERLSGEWHCEHDLVHEHGNWDHVLIGPPGIFLLDSKSLNGSARTGDDALICGRLRFSGKPLRGAALRLKSELEARVDFSARWVQGVVVIWGDFPQRICVENNVAYLAAEELVTWLEAKPDKFSRPQRAALIEATRELRDDLRAAT
jgi:hypothetical protein